MKKSKLIGNSIYQRESKAYYDLLRGVHTEIFSFNADRIEAEKEKQRYFDGNVEGIKNLYTFVEILQTLLALKKNVKGVDYGCGNHFFVSDVRNKFNWDVIGFDTDEAAVDSAKLRYPESASHYIHRDLLRENLPLPDQTQDFVFCNAVIQHFSDDETVRAFREISRILKPGAIFALIFKRNIENWREFSKTTGLDVTILNASEGKIKIEDEPMKNAIQMLSDEKLAQLKIDYVKGARLFHFFSTEKIITLSKKCHLETLADVEFKKRIMKRAIFTYLSGKNIPTACIFFQKAHRRG